MRNLEKNSSDTLESRNLIFYFLSEQLEGLNNTPSSGGEKQLLIGHILPAEDFACLALGF